MGSQDLAGVERNIEPVQFVVDPAGLIAGGTIGRGTRDLADRLLIRIDLIRWV